MLAETPELTKCMVYQKKVFFHTYLKYIPNFLAVVGVKESLQERPLAKNVGWSKVIVM